MKKLLVLLLVVVVLAAAVPVLADGGAWHWNGHSASLHNHHVCTMSCTTGRLDPIRCQCVGGPVRLGPRVPGR